MGAGRLAQPRVWTWGKVGVTPGTAVVAEVGVGSRWHSVGHSHVGGMVLTCNHRFLICICVVIVIGIFRKSITKYKLKMCRTLHK